MIDTHPCSHSMSSSPIAENDPNAYGEPLTRIGTERWWWDRDDEIVRASRGVYVLRPRCQPKWHLSCIKSGNTVEDSQDSIVRLAAIIFLSSAYSNG
jgi:hypothetical protein